MAAAIGSCSARSSAMTETDIPEALKRAIDARFHLAWSSRSASVTRSSATRHPEEATVVVRGTT
eukprot:6310896-Alexandrium_andersonii.AAC.1